MYPDISSQPNQKKKITLLVLLIMAIIVSMYCWRYIKSFADIEILSRNGVTIDLARSQNTYDSEVGEMGAVVVSTTSSVKLRVKKGNYVVKFSQAGKQDLIKTINVPKTTKVESPDLDLSKDKLTEMLAGTEARTVAMNIVGRENYKILYESLYKQGDWYAAVMSPNSASLDIRRIILRKDSSGWAVAASPAIVFYTGDFPKIPEQIIRDINNQQP